MSNQPLSLHQLSRALEKGGTLTLSGYTLCREVSDEGSYVVVGEEIRYPCESLPVALAALATIAGMVLEQTKENEECPRT